MAKALLGYMSSSTDPRVAIKAFELSMELYVSLGIPRAGMMRG